MIALVTGGSGSGKSAFAEDLACRLDREEKLYLATMCPCDAESHKRIARHRQMRQEKGFVTKEQYKDLHLMVPPVQKTVLLECISNLTANELFRAGGSMDFAIKNIVSGVGQLINTMENIVIVTNAVFSDGVIYDTATQQYLETIAQINLQLAQQADVVVEVICGIPVVRKGVL